MQASTEWWVEHQQDRAAVEAGADNLSDRQYTRPRRKEGGEWRSWTTSYLAATECVRLRRRATFVAAALWWLPATPSAGLQQRTSSVVRPLPTDPLYLPDQLAELTKQLTTVHDESSADTSCWCSMTHQSVGLRCRHTSECFVLRLLGEQQCPGATRVPCS
jgi:hypothetical protein